MSKKVGIIVSILILAIISWAVYYKYLSNNQPQKIQNEYSTKQTQDAIARNIPIIDIRRLEEWIQYGTIKTSHKMTFFDRRGNVDINKWMSEFKAIVKDKNQEFILVCAHANRTKAVLSFLTNQGYTNAHDLQGGINYGWIDKGLKTIPHITQKLHK